ncbi:MAG: hydroxymethylglutaryl-CoA lyase [Chloroflexi bacterium]|nr:hydroxymethylglutaryl-CoA lyase [Chloroflexota bacterium]MBV9600173.1 hydroxymethylglutaryl-CoA lyase [Chloroflexota bacterium]
MNREISIREVGTRDGIQSLGAFIDTPRKVELLEALGDTGLRRIEATSFVNPRAVPQMADASEVMAHVRRRPGVSYEALVPNVRGAQDAMAARMDSVLVVLMASEAFNRKNVRMSVDDSLAQSASIKSVADEAGVRCTGAIGTAFGCPYEGDIPEGRVFDLIERFVDLGFDELMLADTTGMANPLQIEHTLGTVLDRWGDRIAFGLHLHNTRGMGLANVVAGLNAGVMTFDASVAGIGGCPFAPQAAGNISTEDTVHMLHEMGYATGIDLERLIEVARLAQDILGRELPGQVMKAGPRWQLHAA